MTGSLPEHLQGDVAWRDGECEAPSECIDGPRRFVEAHRGEDSAAGERDLAVGG